MVMGIGQTALLTTLPLLMQRTGLALEFITMILASGSLAFLAGAPCWGLLSRHLGPRCIVAVALAGFGLSHMLLFWQLGQGSDWEGQGKTLLAGRFLYGLTVSGLVPTCQAWLLAGACQRQQRAVLSRFSAALALGRSLGPALVAGSLWLSPSGPFLLVALSAWPVLLMLPLAVPCHAESGCAGWPDWHLQALLGWPVLTLVIVTAFGLMQYALGPWLMLCMKLDAATASSQLGWMLSAGTLVVAALQIGVVPYCKPGRSLLRAGSVGLVLAGMLLAQATTTLTAMGGVVALGVAAALLGPDCTARALQAAGKSGQAWMAGMVATVHTTGLALGAVLAGWTLGLSPSAPFWLAAFLGLGVVLASLMARVPGEALR